MVNFNVLSHQDPLLCLVDISVFNTNIDVVLHMGRLLQDGNFGCFVSLLKELF